MRAGTRDCDVSAFRVGAPATSPARPLSPSVCASDGRCWCCLLSHLEALDTRVRTRRFPRPRISMRAAGVGRRRRSRSRCDRFVPRQRRAVSRATARENDPPCIGAGGSRLNPCRLPSLARTRAPGLGSLARNPPARRRCRYRTVGKGSDVNTIHARRVFSSILSAGPMLPRTRRTRMRRAARARQRTLCASPGLRHAPPARVSAPAAVFTGRTSRAPHKSFRRPAPPCGGFAFLGDPHSLSSPSPRATRVVRAAIGRATVRGTIHSARSQSGREGQENCSGWEADGTRAARVALAKIMRTGAAGRAPGPSIPRRPARCPAPSRCASTRRRKSDPRRSSRSRAPCRA